MQEALEEKRRVAIQDRAALMANMGWKHTRQTWTRALLVQLRAIFVASAVAVPLSFLMHWLRQRVRHACDGDVGMLHCLLMKNAVPTDGRRQKDMLKVGCHLLPAVAGVRAWDCGT